MGDISEPTSNVSIYNENGKLVEVTDSNELKSTAKLVNDDGDTIGTDASTNALITITYPHHEVHGGSMFTYRVNEEDVKDDTIRVRIDIPAQATGKRIHLVPTFYGTGEIDIEMRENFTSGGNGGTTRTPNNMRRDKQGIKNSIVTLKTDVSNASGGTLLINERRGYKKDKVSAVVGNGIRHEWILGDTTATKYYFEIDSGEDEVAGTLILEWYEHTDKNTI